MRKKILIILGLFLLFRIGGEARGQTSAGVKLQPSIIEEKVEPGQTFSSILRATNLSQESRVFYAVKRDISGLSPGGFPLFAGEGEETRFAIASWIQITSEPIIIAGGQTKEIPFSIAVPKDAAPGGHFGGIFLSLRAERPKETGAGVGFQVATIINLKIAGEVLEEARIREFRTDKGLYSQPQVKFITRVENIGNVLVRPRGPLEITDFFGKKAGTIIVNEDGAAILPKAAREFTASWSGEGLAFGRYQALISLVYGEEGRQTMTSALAFWVLPLKIILPVIGGLAGLILIVYLFIKLHLRKKLRELAAATEAAMHKGALGPLERELLHHKKGAPFYSRAVLLTVVLLIFTLVFLLVLFLLFA